MAPMRKDIGYILSRVEPAWQGGDSRPTNGHGVAIEKSGEVSMGGQPITIDKLKAMAAAGAIPTVREYHLAEAR